jgi:KDO2-lipid IV(A) lauroyltransferase
MNAVIEAQVRRMPEQYLWVHKLCKTRPPGEPSWY